MTGADLYVFDDFPSALDVETEQKVGTDCSRSEM